MSGRRILGNLFQILLGYGYILCLSVNRDGMAQTFTEYKFKDTDHYLKQVMKL